MLANKSIKIVKRPVYLCCEYTNGNQWPNRKKKNREKKGKNPIWPVKQIRGFTWFAIFLHWIVSMNMQNTKIGIHAAVICACWPLCVFVWKNRLFLSIHFVNSYRHTLIYLLWLKIDQMIYTHAENRHFAHSMNPPTLKIIGVVQQFHDWNNKTRKR